GGLAEERLVPLLVRCSAEAVGADSAAVYIQPERKGNKPDWHLSGAHGADPAILAALPASYGEGGGILAPVFQAARDVYERDLLDGAPPDTPVEPRLPFRSLVGVPVRRRDSRAIGVLIVGAVRATAGVKPYEWDEFVARLRERNANPAEIDESEWELATDPPRIVQRYSAPMRSLVGEVVGRVEVYTDVTESRRLYTQLLNSEKLRAIGEMASGVAHDFNNLLASIVGQTELLHPDDLPPTTQLAITTIRQAALDGARMVRNLQGLARPRAEPPST